MVSIEKIEQLANNIEMNLKHTLFAKFPVGLKNELTINENTTSEEVFESIKASWIGDKLQIFYFCIYETSLTKPSKKQILFYTDLNFQEFSPNEKEFLFGLFHISSCQVCSFIFSENFKEEFHAIDKQSQERIEYLEKLKQDELFEYQELHQKRAAHLEKLKQDEIARLEIVSKERKLYLISLQPEFDKFTKDLEAKLSKCKRDKQEEWRIKKMVWLDQHFPMYSLDANNENKNVPRPNEPDEPPPYLEEVVQPVHCNQIRTPIPIAANVNRQTRSCCQTNCLSTIVVAFVFFMFGVWMATLGRVVKNYWQTIVVGFVLFMFGVWMVTLGRVVK